VFVQKTRLHKSYQTTKLRLFLAEDARLLIAERFITDWKNVYQRKATPAEQLRGEVPVTQFGRMCQKLGIGILAASSPQAKGRVERTRRASGSTDQEAEAEEHHELRGGEPVSGERVFAGAQSVTMPCARPQIRSGRHNPSRNIQSRKVSWSSFSGLLQFDRRPALPCFSP
jgi:hypothetical protein